MNLHEYQALAGRTANQDQEPKMRRAIAGLGIAGEAGELADLIKKEVGHGHPPDLEKVKKELGDVLWYCAEVATAYGLSLSDVAVMNINKLKRRYPEGFSSEASMLRVDAY